MKKDTKITLGENEYKVRMTVGVLIDIEEELGTPLTQLSGDISIKQATVFLRHAARKLDGSRIADEEWQDLLYEVEPKQMFDTLGGIMAEINPKTEEETGKND